MPVDSLPPVGCDAAAAAAKNMSSASSSSSHAVGASQAHVVISADAVKVDSAEKGNLTGSIKLSQPATPGVLGITRSSLTMDGIPSDNTQQRVHRCIVINAEYQHYPKILSSLGMPISFNVARLTLFPLNLAFYSGKTKNSMSAALFILAKKK